MKTTLHTWTRHWLIDGEHLYRRAIQLLVALLLLTWIGSNWYSVGQRGDEVTRLQTEALARVILSQASHEARVWILEENADGLYGLAHHLQQQEGILEVSIQDAQGRSLVRAGHDMAVQDYLTSLPTYLTAVPKVSPIDDNGRVVGFMRITFDYQRILAESDMYQRAYMQRSGFLIFLSVLAGFLLAISILKRRPRQVTVAEVGAGAKPNQQAKSQLKPQSKLQSKNTTPNTKPSGES